MKCKVFLATYKKKSSDMKSREFFFAKKGSKKTRRRKKLLQRQCDLIGSGVENGNGLFLLLFLSLSSSDDVTHKTSSPSGQQRMSCRTWRRTGTPPLHTITGLDWKSTSRFSASPLCLSGVQQEIDDAEGTERTDAAGDQLRSYSNKKCLNIILNFFL